MSRQATRVTFPCASPTCEMEVVARGLYCSHACKELDEFLKPRKVVCRDCGVGGFETDDDVMPSTCPACFDARVRPIFFGPDPARTDEELVQRLIATGCAPQHIGALIRDLRAAYEARQGDA